jgi:hypothetical protein
MLLESRESSSSLAESVLSLLNSAPAHTKRKTRVDFTRGLNLARSGHIFGLAAKKPMPQGKG